MLAIVAAAVALAVVLTLALRGDGDGRFSGDEEIATMARLAHRMDNANFEPVKTPVAEVGDWLLTKGFNGYRVPGDLADVMVTGCAVTKNDVTPVAVLLLDGGSKRASVFPASPAGTGLPEDGSWNVYELPAAHGSPRLAIAAGTAGGVCFLVSSPCPAADLRNWLHERAAASR